MHNLLSSLFIKPCSPLWLIQWGGRILHMDISNDLSMSQVKVTLPIIPGGTLNFKWQRWSNGGKNQNPKKFLDQNLTPQKSHAEFPSHKNFQKAEAVAKQVWFYTLFTKLTLLGVCGNYRKSANLLFLIPKQIPTLIKLPRKYLPKVSYPKKSQNQRFHAPKKPSIIPVTWNPESQKSRIQSVPTLDLSHPLSIYLTGEVLTTLRFRWLSLLQTKTTFIYKETFYAFRRRKL